MKRKHLAIVIIISIVVIITLSIYMDKKRESDTEYVWFVNTTYSLINRIERDIESILMIEEHDEKHSLDNLLISSSHNLIELERLLNDGGRLLSRELYTDEIWGFDFIAKALLGTAYANGIAYKGSGFLEDNKIDEKEAEFLKELHKDLLGITERLMTNYGHDVNVDISKGDFRKIFSDFFKKWGYGNYHGTEDEYKSPYENLIK